MMKMLTRIVVPAVLALVISPAAPPAMSAEGEMMETMRKGKELFQTQCLNCHKTVAEAAKGHRSRPQWEKVVTDMVGEGAELDETQQKAVVDYLYGKTLLAARCSSCHTYARPLTKNKSLMDWVNTVDRMKQKMPPGIFQPGDVELISTYLAVERPFP